MALTWHRGHFEHGAVAYEGARLVGQAARYDETDRPGSTNVVAHFFIGYVRGNPVTGRCPTLEEAQATVEAADAGS